MIIKSTILTTSFLFFLSIIPVVVHAESLFVVTPEGHVQQNVLGDSTDTKAAVNKVVQKVASAAVDGVTEMILTTIENKTQVKLVLGSKEETIEAGPTLTELIQIENSTPSEKISIEKFENGFGISQGGIIATTSLPVKVIPKSHEVTVADHSLTVLPAEALATVVRGNALTSVSSTPDISVTEENGNLMYMISGEKEVRIFDITKVSIPLQTRVSADTGEVTVVNEPSWFKVLTFLFG